MNAEASLVPEQCTLPSVDQPEFAALSRHRPHLHFENVDECTCCARRGGEEEERDTVEDNVNPEASGMPQDVDDLVELSRVLVSVAYRSLAAAPESVSLPHFRALAVLARHGPCTAGGLAQALGQHPSTVTRIGDKLVAAGWVTRGPRSENRREVELCLTTAGRRLTRTVLRARARELDQILARLSPARRRALALLLPELLDAAHTVLDGRAAAWAV
jgi:DNA-binding MarR family transcriptional regulator